MNEQFINLYKQAYNKIKEADNVLILTHFNPDGDGLSSLCAMIELFEQLGKRYFAYCYNQPPAVFSFLPHLEKIRYDKAENQNSDGSQSVITPEFENFDLIVVLDCGSMSRTKLESQILARRADQQVIEFDHHPKVDDYADIEIRNPELSATAEVIYYLFKLNQLKISKNIAQCILTGILTDTANFLYPSTSEKTVEIASQMLSLGARLPKIMENTLRNKSLSAMKIWGRVMANLQVNHKYNIASTVLTLDEINGENISKEELDGISGFLSNLYGVKAILFLREEEGEIIRGSLRTSDPNTDISKLAQLLGGGGHPKASGFSVNGRIEKTEKGWKVV